MFKQIFEIPGKVKPTKSHSTRKQNKIFLISFFNVYPSKTKSKHSLFHVVSSSHYRLSKSGDQFHKYIFRLFVHTLSVISSILTKTKIKRKSFYCTWYIIRCGWHRVWKNKISVAYRIKLYLHVGNENSLS